MAKLLDVLAKTTPHSTRDNARPARKTRADSKLKSPSLQSAKGTANNSSQRAVRTRSIGGFSIAIKAGLLVIAILVKIGRHRPSLIVQHIDGDVIVVDLVDIGLGGTGLDIGEFNNVKRAGFFEFQLPLGIDAGLVAMGNFEFKRVGLDLQCLGNALSVRIGLLQRPFSFQLRQVIGQRGKGKPSEDGRDREESFHSI